MTTPKRMSKRRREVDGRIEKYCIRCASWKPATELVKDATCQDGLAPRCRSCENALWNMRKAKARPRNRIRIGDVAESLSETANSIIWWSREFGIEPVRTDNGYRWYSAEQVAFLREIQSLLRTELFTIEGAKRQLRLAAERERQAG